MSYCPKCTNWCFGTVCKCQPFRCGNEDFSGEDRTVWRVYYAVSPESAATKWAKRYDQDKHPLLDDDTVECEVIAADGTVKKFKVSGKVSLLPNKSTSRYCLKRKSKFTLARSWANIQRSKEVLILPI